VHLKRFSEEEGYGGREKIDTLVHFPLQGLDLKPYMRGAGSAGQQGTPQVCNSLQHTATHCNTLQHTATLCNTL